MLEDSSFDLMLDESEAIRFAVLFVGNSKADPCTFWTSAMQYLADDFMAHFQLLYHRLDKLSTPLTVCSREVVHLVFEPLASYWEKFMYKAISFSNPEPFVPLHYIAVSFK